MGKSHSRHSNCYKEGKGYVLIINNVNFSTLEDRAGSDKDEEKIKDTLFKRCCEVDPLKNCTANGMIEALQSLNGHTGRNFVIVFFLTHGYSSGVYGTDGVPLTFEEIQSQLTAANCPAFDKKPKILVFPTCRMGERQESGTRAIEANFLLAFGTQPQSPAFRDEELGTYYIQQLLSVIEDKGDKEDLVSMLTEVKRVMIDQKEIVPQDPDYHSSLTDKVYLRKKSSDAKLIIGKKKKNSHAQSTESNETEQVTGHDSAGASATGATYSSSVISGRTMGISYICNTKTKDSENSSKRSSTSSDEIEVNEPIPTNYDINETDPLWSALDVNNQLAPHELLIQGTEDEITIRTESIEETQPQWIDVSGDHSETPQSTNNEEDDELVNTLTVGNTSVLQSVITEEGYINIVNAEVLEREVDDWVVFDTT